MKDEDGKLYSAINESGTLTISPEAKGSMTGSDIKQALDTDKARFGSQPFVVLKK